MRPALATEPRDTALRAARTCYDHLAGHLGVALTEALVTRGHVELTHTIHDVEFFLPAIGDDNLRAFLLEGEADRVPQSTGAAFHQCHLSRESRAHFHNFGV